MAKFFEDIGQDSNDLLNKGFPNAGTARVITETKTGNGVSLTATGRRFVKDKATAVDLALEPKFDWSARGVEFSGTFNTSAEYSGSVTGKDLFAKGTKFVANIAQGPKGLTTKETVSFKNDNAATKASSVYTVNGDKPLVLEGSAVGAYEKRFFGGVNLNYTLALGDKAAALLWGVKAGIDQDGVQGHLFANTTDKNLFVGAGWIQKISNALRIAANLTADAKQVAGPAATLGSEYKFDDLTTLKSKVLIQSHTDGSKPVESRLGLGLKQSFNANVSATLGADVNVRQVLGTNAGADHSFGLDLKFAQ